MGTFLPLLLLPLCTVLLHPTTAICVPRTNPHAAAPIVVHTTSVPPPPPAPVEHPPPPPTPVSPPPPTPPTEPPPAPVENSPDRIFSPFAKDSPDAEPSVGKLPPISDLVGMGSLFPKLVLPRITGLANAAVQSICNAATNPSICQAYAHSFLPPGGGNIDPFRVMELQMTAAKNLTEFVVSSITHIVHAPIMPPALRTVLGRCLDLYNGAPDNIENALKAIAVRDTGTMDSQFSALLDNFQCKNEFQKAGLIKFPVLGFEDVLYNLAGNCLDINAKLVEKRLYN